MRSAYSYQKPSMLTPKALLRCQKAHNLMALHRKTSLMTSRDPIMAPHDLEVLNTGKKFNKMSLFCSVQNAPHPTIVFNGLF